MTELGPFGTLESFFDHNTVLSVSSSTSFNMHPRRILLFSIATLSAAVGKGEFDHICPCVYETHPDDEAGCRVFGLLGKVIPWHRASDQCTDALELGIRPYGTDWLWNICPNHNGTDANVDAIINLIRSNEDSFAEEVRAKYPQYFVASGNGTELVDEILSGQGIKLDCIETESFCWSEIKIFFNQNPVKAAALCAELHDRQKVTLEKEQSEARVQLCERDEVVIQCEDLIKQVKEMKVAKSDCQAFGNQAAAEDIPDIKTCGKKEEASSYTPLSVAGSITLAIIMLLSSC